jgi:hypothetical protein
MRLVRGLARGVLGRLLAGVRTPAGIVTLAVGLALLLRLPFLHRLAFPDEAGLLIVASTARSSSTGRRCCCSSTSWPTTSAASRRPG